MGNGTTGGTSLTPQAVKGIGGTGTLGGISAIEAGKAFSGAILGQNGTILTWGQRTSGQMGNGGTANTNLPIEGTSLMGQTALALGAYHVLSLESTRQVTLTYGYDRLSRLTSGGTPGTPNTYTYDPNGNRLSLTQGNAVATQYAYDQADRLLTVGTSAYTTDADGNLTAYPGVTLTYDQANRLVSFTANGTKTTYAYDGDGKRTSKTVGTTTTGYAYDANRSLPVVLSDGTLKYVWGVGLAYATDYAGTVQEVYHTDGLGSVRAITNAAGSTVQTYLADEFGVASLVQGSSTQPFQFTGEQRDAESSFVFLRARYYAPTLGRFLSRDTIVESIARPLALNRSVYADDNPASLVDPTGHQEAYQDELRRMEGEGPLIGGGIAFTTSPEEEAASANLAREEAPTTGGNNQVGAQAVNTHVPLGYVGPLPGYPGAQ